MKKLMTIAEAAAALGTGQATLRRWDAEGKLPAGRTLGGHRRFRAADVDALLRQNAGDERRPDYAPRPVAASESNRQSPELMSVPNEARRYIIESTTRPVPWLINDPVYQCLLRSDRPPGYFFTWDVESSDVCMRLCERRVQARLFPGVTLDLLKEVIRQTVREYAVGEVDRRIRAEMIANGLNPE